MAVTPQSATPRNRFGWVGQWGWLLGLLLAGVALYRSTPLMTGPLSDAHAAFEKACSTCHIADGAGAVADEACLKCHGLIRTIGDAGAIHRRATRGCPACHQEHRSRRYPIRLSDPLSFDHDQTGWPLKQHHRSVACTGCHRPGSPYYSVRKRCADCHPDWDRTNFKHKKSTGVSLLRHEEFACTDCHPGKRYEALPICTPCHEKVYRPGDTL